MINTNALECQFLGKRYQTLFTQLAAKNQGAFIPFVTLGDPNPELSLTLIDTLIKNGADALELGFPFSDPLADGPVIQAANLRSLQGNTTSSICFDIIAKIRRKHPNIPIGLLLYANLVYANGINTFYEKARIAGVDSVLIADVPLEEANDFIAAATAHQIAPIFIAPPNANKNTLKAISQNTKGYTYLLSRSGVTGTETKASMPIDDIIDTLKNFDAPPAILGFGISDPNQVNLAIKSGASGVICGSAIVQIIENNINCHKAMLTTLGQFTQKMKLATRY